MAFACEDEKEIVRIARLCARIILENGGETYRAEETVCRICRAYGFDETDVIAMPTGVFISVSRDGAQASSVVKRIRKRGFNLQAIDEVNSIARQLTAGSLTPTEALRQLHAVCEMKPLPWWMMVLAAGLSSGCFALLFRGSVYDFCAAALCGTLAQLAARLIRTADMFSFAVSIVGGIVIGVCSLLWVRLTGTGELQNIITGAMMPLLPGIPMTNAIRDTMRGDLVSGVARAAEALLIAAAIAFGIGVVLKIYVQLFA